MAQLAASRKGLRPRRRWAVPTRTPRALPRGCPARHPAVRLPINETMEPLHGMVENRAIM